MQQLHVLYVHTQLTGSYIHFRIYPSTVALQSTHGLGAIFIKCLRAHLLDYIVGQRILPLVENLTINNRQI